MIALKHHHPIELPDTHQSAWQLAAIQLSGWTSLPILATSILILGGNSFLGAVLTILLGNIILWFIRFGIISMSFEKRQSTLDISREYLGNFGNYFIATLLLVSTLAWFITQTTSGSTSINQLLPINEDPDVDQFIQVSAFLGVISTLFCMGGIVVLRKISSICFPILTILFLSVIYTLPVKIPSANIHQLSFYGLGMVLATNLGFTADLPTFFRHSKSWNTSVKALTFIQLISLGLALCSLFLGSIISQKLDLNYDFILVANNDWLRIFLICFIFLSVVCANVANVYSASVAWELVAPTSLIGSKEYFILGLGLTTIFILITDFISMEFLLNFSDNSLVNLSIVLLVGYIISRLRKQPPNFFEQVTYFISWLVSTVVNTLQIQQVILLKYSPVAVGSTVIFGVVFCSILSAKMFFFGLRKKL